MILNKIQKKAIHLINNPCLILAGAGSGKTSVIINKIIVLIKIYGYNPKKIFAITFTNKAAKEIKLRLVNQLTMKQIKEISISTFHSLGLKIIRNEYKFLGLIENFTLFDEKEQLLLLKSFISDLDKNYNIFFLKQLLYQISFWKNNLLDAKLARLKISSMLEEKCIFFYEKYEFFLKEHNILDFHDLIFLPTNLLKKNINIQLKWQKKIQYLLIDEYQDVNSSQYKLIKLLCGYNSNLTVVGDNDQSIYSWRGAETKIFYLLKNDFPNLNILKMEQNYRSSGRILHVANILISHNINFFHKKLFSKLDYGNKIYILKSMNEIHEAQQIIQYIKFHKNKYQGRYNDYAILYRSNYQVRAVETELIYQNIPYLIHSGCSFFDLLEIKDLLAYLRLVINQNDDFAFLRIINVPNRKIGLITISKLKKFAKNNKISLFVASTDNRMKLQLRKNIINTLNNFVVWILKLTLILSKKPEKILEYIIRDTKYFSWIQNFYTDSVIIKKKKKNIVFFSKWLKKMLIGNDFHIPMKLEDILIHFICGDLDYSSFNTKKKRLDKLQLMTIHSSKGLEFPVVCIIGMEEGTLPHQKSILDNNITEERRLLYVGITRAKSQLFLSFCKKKRKFGMIMHLQPSRFLFELPKREIIWIKNII
ncbi:UvrD-helicase domain-containing protein [Buchnera aphidicola]|uniref:DNA 3'-5' helicase n=1 Tax=Buchnera aphidicola subsp. Cinara cedri (strain Cc) TaxID=372461 RepID=Q056W5_BUCCC|nr:UvrD-helicase domain-containing protein [Buchnera aphidicola]ABJ90834.1 ATP-dependent DNA helicase [Buchnera aphidicola BCc]